MLFRALYLPVVVLSFLLASNMSFAQGQSRPKTSSEIADRTKSSREGYEEILAAYEEQLKSQLVELARRKKLNQEGQLADVYVRLSVHDMAVTQAHIAEIRQWIFEDDLAMTERLAREEILRGPSLRSGGYAETALLIRFNGPTAWSLADAGKIENFFVARFGRALPVSARGQTAAHDRMRFDHHDAMDVAVSPDSDEGRALMVYLKQGGIPFIAFRGKMAGSATGAHIHIGKPSLRLASPR
jgi:hypothetical protein